MKRLVALIALVFVATFLHVPQAYAVRGGTLHNSTGSRVWVDCNLGKRPTHDRTVYAGQRSGCADTDAFQLRYDRRCVAIYVWGTDKRVYKADPGHWFKLRDFHHARTTTYSGCSKAPWISTYLTRL